MHYLVCDEFGNVHAKLSEKKYAVYLAQRISEDDPNTLYAVYFLEFGLTSERRLVAAVKNGDFMKAGNDEKTN